MREKVREERGADMGEKGLSRACELAREVEIDKGEDEEDTVPWYEFDRRRAIRAFAFEGSPSRPLEPWKLAPRDCEC